MKCLFNSVCLNAVDTAPIIESSVLIIPPDDTSLDAAIIPHRQAGYPILLQRSFFFFARRSCSEQSTFHGQASDRVWFFPNCSFKASRKKKVSPFPLSSPPRVINELNSPVISRHTLLSVARKFCCKGAEGGGCAQDGAAMELSILEGELTEP